MSLVYFGFAVVISVFTVSVGITLILEIWRERKLRKQWNKDIVEGTANRVFGDCKQRGKQGEVSKKQGVRSGINS